MTQRRGRWLLLAALWAAPAWAQSVVITPSPIPAVSVGCVLQVQSISPTVWVCGSAGSGSVSSTGTLTADTLTAWSSSGVLKNSIITQSGSVASAATFNATTALTLNGNNINTAGTLGNVVYVSTAPVLTGTNFTGVPVSTGISGMGTGVATFLATPSSANLATAITNETGSGALVFATSPTLVTPTLGVASATSLTLAGALSGVTTIGASGVLTVAPSAVGAIATFGSASGTRGYLYSEAAAFYLTTAAAAGGTGVGFTSSQFYFVVGGNAVVTADSSGNLSPTGSLILAATKKLYLDGGGDTYAWESAGNTFDLVAGGTTMLSLTTTATFGGNTIVSSAALGNTSAGRSMQVGRNSTRGGAAGTIEIIGLGGASNFLWADGSAAPGVLRIKATAPVEDNGTTSDRSGTVVGAQTSTLDTKDLIGDAMDPADAFALLVATPVKRFTYKGDNAYGGTVFQGIIADWSPDFAMDPDAAHPNGRSFNAVSAFGVTVQAMKAIEARLAALDAEVTALRRQVIK